MLLGPTQLSRKRADEVIKHEDTVKKPLADVIVYTWRTKYGSVGHQTLLIKPHDQQADHHYISFWPKNTSDNISDMLPFLFSRSEAKIITAIQDDIQGEGTMPDYILRFQNLDYKAMCDYHEKLNVGVTRQEIKYQFLYNHSPFNQRSFSSKASNIFSGDVSDIEYESPYQNKGANCTSIVREVIEAGGIAKKTFELMPWGDTPLGQHLLFQMIGGDCVKEQAVIDTYVELAGSRCGTGSHFKK
jgi:hypothetical protein